MTATRRNVLVWLTLLVLAGASLGLSYVNLGEATVAVALGIASVKAALVALFFMELIEQRFAQRAVLVVALVFVAVLAGLMIADVATRDPAPIRPAVRYG